MEGGEGGGGGLVVRGRVEIDMRQPFRSVKEAVMLFGEKVLAGEIYGNKLKEMKSDKENSEGHQLPSKFGAVTAELEEAKQSLEKAREEGSAMAHCLQSLKQELEQTRKELHQLKAREYENKEQLIINPEIEELKFVENPENVALQQRRNDAAHHHHHYPEFQKKRSVKFASPPTLTRVIVSPEMVEDVKTSPSSGNDNKKLKRKPLIPMIGGLFSKKKGSKDTEVQMPRA